MASPGAPTRRAVGAALLAAVRTDRDDALARHVRQHGTTALARAARQHGVEGLVDLALRRVGAATPETRAARVGAAAAHLRARGALEEVGGALDAAGVPWLTVKGPVLAGHYYERIDLRRYVDLDVLVGPSDVPAARRALSAAGAATEGADDEPDPGVPDPGEPGELTLLGSGGIPVDLHWHLVAAPGDRRRVHLPTATLLERRRMVDIGGICVPSLDPVDTLVHVALHAGLSGGARVVWLVDIDRVVAKGPLEWAELVDRARDAGVGPLVGLMLRRARWQLETPVPDEVLTRLGPGVSWLLAQRALQRWTPVGVARTDASTLRLLTRATRRGSLASWAALAAHGLRWAGSATGGTRRAHRAGAGR